MFPEHAWPAGRLARALLQSGHRQATLSAVQQVTGYRWRVARHLVRQYGLQHPGRLELLALVDDGQVAVAIEAEPPPGMGPDPDCETCFGTGHYLDHSPDCMDDLCALNGDEFCCTGVLVRCSCVVEKS